MARRPPRPDPEKLRLEVENWNLRYPVGTPVTVRRDRESDPATVETKTRSEAYVLSGHSAVIMVEGISGYYLLNRVTARVPAEAQ